jgi:eukaryotic-like serine/threonine-protein kinase
VTPARYQQLKAVFEQVVELAPPERVSSLEAACAGDPELRRELDSLLADLDTSEEILDQPISALAAALRGEDHRGLVGQRVGPYRLERLLGRGGMGTVYEAWRADDQYCHRVALKVIRDGTAVEPLVGRFRQERQILAALSHPHIARLLDGGVTSDGQPYLVMEYVEGEPIDQYCNARRLGIRERLRLFRDVCAAVQYAHQNLVVHRDLKPSNILVTADGEVKLLDFGIAKLLRAGEEEPAPLTRTGLHLMTPDYASPEQVRGGAITTAADIYSLGIVLYELLTGRRPFQLGQHLQREIEQIICEEEPAKPSTAVTREMAVTIGAERPDRLRRSLIGDLDNIILRSLRKEPPRRYASVEQLSRDLEHYLDGLPVLAQRPTLQYRAVKFLRRHRSGVTAAGLLVLTLIGGIVTTTWQARVARAERNRAERRFADVRRLANSFLFEFHDAIQNLAGATPARQLVVKRALEYLDSLTTEKNDDVPLQLELAVAYQRICKIQGDAYSPNLGDTRGALVSCGKALSILEPLQQRHAQEPTITRMLASAHSNMGDLLAGSVRTEDALGHYRSQLRYTESLLGSPAEQPEDHRDFGKGCQKIGAMLVKRGRRAEGLTELRRALRALEDLYATGYVSDRRSLDLSVMHNLIGQVLEADEDYQAALASYQQSTTILVPKAQREPSHAEVQRALAVSYGHQGDVLLKSGNVSSALARYRESQAIRERLAQADPHDMRAKRDVSVGERRLGDVLLGLGKTSAALVQYREALKRREDLASNSPASTLAQSDLAASQYDVGRALAQQGHLEQALAYLIKAASTAGRALQLDPQDAKHREDLITILSELGGLQKEKADLAGSRVSYQRAIQIATEIAGGDPPRRAEQRQVAQLWQRLTALNERRGGH